MKIRPLIYIEHREVVGYTYFLWYVDYYSAPQIHQQDFALYDASAPQERITGFTSIAGKTSSNPGTENYPNGFDGNQNTKWYSDNTYPNWCIFTADRPISPVGVSYMPPGDQPVVPDRAPRAFRLCGCNDYTTDPLDSRWETIYSTADNPVFTSVRQSYVWVDLYFQEV